MSNGNVHDHDQPADVGRQEAPTGKIKGIDISS